MHPELLRELCPYMAGVLKQLGCMPIIVNGVNDHIHLLFVLSTTKSISEIVRELKKASSAYIKSKDAIYEDFEWQKGYGAFSVSAKDESNIIDYISAQPIHHAAKSKSFDYEFRFFLKRNGFDPNGPYVLTD